eukprot:5210627-Ditylum_brightwellii.AAC.1
MHAAQDITQPCFSNEWSKIPIIQAGCAVVDFLLLFGGGAVFVGLSLYCYQLSAHSSSGLVLGSQCHS